MDNLNMGNFMEIDFNSIINPPITDKQAISHIESFCTKVKSY